MGGADEQNLVQKLSAACASGVARGFIKKHAEAWSIVCLEGKRQLYVDKQGQRDETKIMIRIRVTIDDCKGIKACNKQLSSRASVLFGRLFRCGVLGGCFMKSDSSIA